MEELAYQMISHKRKLATAAEAEEPAGEEVPAGEEAQTARTGGLEAEIEMLRRTMGGLAAAQGRARSTDEQLRIAQTLSLIGERLAQMLLAQKKLGERDGSDLEAWLQGIASEVLEEHGEGRKVG
jgi:Mg-chelatase subunit ChlI